MWPDLLRTGAYQLQPACLTSLFAALITVDGTSRDSRPSGNGKTTCNDEDALQYHIAGFICEVLISVKFARCCRARKF